MSDEKTNVTGQLVNSEQAVVAEEKLTRYSLDLESETEKARSKAEKFSRVLGIEKKDWQYVRQVLLDGIQRYRPVKISDIKNGKSYTVMIPIRGLNENKVILETAWQYLGGNNFPQLITAFIPRKNKERRYLFLLDDLED